MLKRILLLADWYEPGYKAGGPIRSCVNFTRWMSDDYKVFVFTSDRDLGSGSAYPGVLTDAWSPVDPGSDSKVYYCSPSNLTWKNIRRQIEVIQPDFIYLNSMFSTKFTIFPLMILFFRNASVPRPRVVLAPRGMLRDSAIRFKSGKKRLFLSVFRLLGIHRHIHFQATDETERRDIFKHFGPSSRVSMVPNFPGSLAEEMPHPVKQPGHLSLIFVGRIHPIKNLDFLLRILCDVSASVHLTVVGGMEDRNFWVACEELIRQLPANILVNYAGEIPNHALPALIARHHVFSLPTKGENFGHAIFEALALGRPVLISDQTPWKNLEAAGAGWDLPLDQPERFRQAIEKAAALGPDEYAEQCRTTRQYLADYLAGVDLKKDYINLFS